MTKDSTLHFWRDTRKARRAGADAIAERQRDSLADLVALARARSPFYEELCRDLPARIDDVRLLPVTNKKQLMARFDDWATDRDVTLEKDACGDKRDRPRHALAPGVFVTAFVSWRNGDAWPS